MKYACLCLLICSVGLAQAPEPDSEGCKDSKLINRIRGCNISECRVTEHDEVELRLADKGGETVTRNVEGALERLEFLCPHNISPFQIMRNMQNAFKTAGFEQVFSGRESSDHYYLTVKKRAQWIGLETYINGSEPTYIFTAILSKDVDQQLEATAEAWGSALETSGRVQIYGINFDTGKATIRTDSENVLGELLKLLEQKADWSVLVEGHTDNVGAKAANVALSRQRSEAVIAWLAAKGLDKTRLSAAGLGDSKPVADNTTEEGRAKNRRVEVVKLSGTS
jgi:OmpA-OmpF porin, OOP family